MVELIQSSLLSQYPRVIHGFSRVVPDRKGLGNMSLNTGREAEVLESRRRFCRALGADPRALTMADQIHSAQVLAVSAADRGKGAETLTSPLGKADALCTGESGLPLSVLVADCAAVFLYDPCRQVIGLAHSGWRGTLQGIVPRMVSLMQDRYGSQTDDLCAWVSPCIGPDAFEVGSEVVEQFKAVNPRWASSDDWRRPVPGDDSKWLLDLKGMIYGQLTGSGILEDRIEISRDCTYRSGRYFSYRRDGRGVGHMMALLALKDAS